MNIIFFRQLFYRYFCHQYSPEYIIYNVCQMLYIIYLFMPAKSLPDFKRQKSTKTCDIPKSNPHYIPRITYIYKKYASGIQMSSHGHFLTQYTKIIQIHMQKSYTESKICCGVGLSGLSSIIWSNVISKLIFVWSLFEMYVGQHKGKICRSLLF